MPSETDDTRYSVFGDESDANDTPDETARDDGPTGESDGHGSSRAAADGRPVGLGGDGTGCPKCGGTETETNEIATSGTGLTKMFDVQNRTFVVVSCADCGYSELYKGQSSGTAIDFFLG